MIDTTDLSAKELSERVMKMFRLEHDFTLRILSFGFKHAPPRDADLVIDVPEHTVRRTDGTELNLTPLEFDLLLEMARHPGQVHTRESLLESVWGYRNASDTRLVNVHVQRLRAKIEHDPEDPQIVLTVRGVGYVLREE